jgi:RimJ/RimL family protein N-acetyltransferase
VIRTPRLVGEPIGERHLDVLVRLWSDPEVMATMGGPKDEATVRADTAKWARHWNEHGYGLWVLFDAETGAPVGRGGLAVTEVDGRAETEVAYALFPQWWGRGLATEIALASVDAAGDAGLTEVVGMTLPTNVASQRVLERVGFVRAGQTTHGGTVHVLYRLKLAP